MNFQKLRHFHGQSEFRGSAYLCGKTTNSTAQLKFCGPRNTVVGSYQCVVLCCSERADQSAAADQDEQALHGSQVARS